MGDRQVNAFVWLDKYAAVRTGLQVYPAVLELSTVIIGERNLLIGQRQLAGTVQARNDAGLNHDLKAVTDTQDELAVLDKLMQNIAEMMHNLIGQYLARRNVVTIAESARKNDNLIAIQHRRVINDSINVNSLGLCSGQLQRMLRFQIAVDPCRS